MSASRRSEIEIGKIELTKWTRPNLLAIAGGRLPPAEPPEPPSRPLQTHPGFFIEKRFMSERRMTVSTLAWDLSWTEDRTLALLAGRVRVNPEIATELSQVFGLSPMFFMNLQNRHDLDKQSAATPPAP